MSDEKSEGVSLNAEVPVTLHVTDGSFEHGEGTHVRSIGCPGHRNCLVEHVHGSLVFSEKGRTGDGDHVVTMGVDSLFRKAFVAILKANDGLATDAALEVAVKQYNQKLYDDTHDER